MNDLFNKLKTREINTIAVHSGKFHADDAFCVALAMIINPDIKVIRVNSVSEDLANNQSILVADIGGGEYDHHQAFTKCRPPKEGSSELLGVKYAAFGLMWKDIGPFLVGEEIAQKIDDNLVSHIDYADNNAGSTNLLTTQVAMFSPLWDDEDDNMYNHFIRAAKFCKGILIRTINSYTAAERAYTVVSGIIDHSYDHSGILSLDRYIPYGKAVTEYNDNYPETKIKFVVYPSIRGGFNAYIVKRSDHQPVVLFPEEWAAYNGAELEEKSGIKDLTFCHNNKHIIAGNTRESVIEACKKAIAIDNKN